MIIGKLLGYYDYLLVFIGIIAFFAGEHTLAASQYALAAWFCAKTT